MSPLFRMLHLLVEYVPVAMGYVVAIITLSVGIALVIARIPRSLIGPAARGMKNSLPIRTSYRRITMRPGIPQRLPILIGLLLSPGMLVAQSHQTSNTLNLDQPAERPSATLADVRFLIGHWRGEFLGSMAEEVWLPPAGKSMLGVFRLYEEHKPIFFEIMTCVEEEGSVSLKLKHFHPDLKGWEEKDGVVTFRLVKVEEDAAWFEGLTYRRHEDGSLRGFIAISQKDSSVAEHAFTLRPVEDE